MDDLGGLTSLTGHRVVAGTNSHPVTAGTHQLDLSRSVPGAHGNDSTDRDVLDNVGETGRL